MLMVIICGFVGTVFSILTFIYVKLIRQQKALYDNLKAQGVPCEPFVPIFGQMFDVIQANKQSKGMEYFTELAHKHGYHFVMSPGPTLRFIIFEPELLADVLSRSKAAYYEKTAFVINILKPIIGVHNLILNKHEEHERARKMLNPAFHSVNLQSMVPVMSNEARKRIESLLETSSATTPVQLNIELGVLTFSVIASCAFGQSFENLPYGKEMMSRAFTEGQDIIQYRTLRLINQVKILDKLPFWGKKVIDNISKNLNEFVKQAIIDRQNGKSSSLCSGPDLLDLLLSAVDNEGKLFSIQEINDEALTFVLAGHETTGNLLTWALYILMLHPDVLQACREEVDRVLPNETFPTADHLSDLQVIEAVLHETLRLYPSAPIVSRQCVKAHTISSSDGQLKFHIPVGAILLSNAYVLHRREDYWPHALEFDYKRWMRDPITGLKPKLPHPFAYLPFGAGPRNCIGQNFALMEGKIILAMFVQRCEFQLVPGQLIIPQSKSITMVPKYGLNAYIKQREF